MVRAGRTFSGAAPVEVELSTSIRVGSIVRFKTCYRAPKELVFAGRLGVVIRKSLASEFVVKLKRGGLVTLSNEELNETVRVVQSNDQCFSTISPWQAIELLNAAQLLDGVR